jgi:hypothetical protein
MKILKSPAISAFGGMNFVFEYLQNNGFSTLVNQSLPSLKNQIKYSWSDILNSLLSIYLCGGDCIEDLQSHLKVHFENNPFVQVPSPDTVLRRFAQLAEQNKHCRTKTGSVDHDYNTNPILENLNVSILKKLGVFSSKELIIDYDNTIIFNEKSDSRMTYKRHRGYQPGVCTVNEEQVLYIENRNGHSDAKAFQADTLKRMFNLLEANGVRKADHFRADAASYQFDVIDLLNEKVKNFYIGCRNSYVDKYFSSITQWEPMEDSQGDSMEVGEIIISPFEKHQNKAELKEYRLIVKRKQKNDNQMDLFTGDAYEYRGILTNNHDLSAKEVALFYNHRGNMEKQFDILKNDFGWNQMPFSNLSKNAVFLYFTAICRNLYTKIINHFSTLQKTLKPTFRLKKFLFRFIILPAKWIIQSRQYKLRIYSNKYVFT